MSLMSFIQGNATHGLGEPSAPRAVEHTSWEIWGKNGFYEAVEAATQKQGVIG